MVVAAVGRLEVFCVVEEEVCVVPLPAVVVFEAPWIGWVVTTTTVFTPVLTCLSGPREIKVESEVDVMTVCVGDCCWDVD